MALERIKYFTLSYNIRTIKIFFHLIFQYFIWLLYSEPYQLYNHSSLDFVISRSPQSFYNLKFSLFKKRPKSINLLVISCGRNKIAKRRNLYICIRLLVFHAMFNEFKSDLLGKKSAFGSALWSTLSLWTFLLSIIYLKSQMSHPSYNGTISSF